MSSNTIRNTPGKKTGIETKAKPAFGNRAPLAEPIDYQRVLHDEYDLRSCPVQTNASCPIRISEEHFDHQLF